MDISDKMLHRSCEDKSESTLVAQVVKESRIHVLYDHGKGFAVHTNVFEHLDNYVGMHPWFPLGWKRWF